MKPKDRIRNSLKEFVEPRLVRLGFAFRESSLTFVRKNGVFIQKIDSHLNRYNYEDFSARFYFSFSVRSNYYVKWHQKEFGEKPTNNSVAGEMYWNLKGWQHAEPDVALEENVEREMLQLLDDTLSVGLPFLEQHSDWENAAIRLVNARWFHAKACDFFKIAGDVEKAHWCLEKAIDDWDKQPNRSFFVGEKEEVKLRFEKFFGENPSIE